MGRRVHGAGRAHLYGSRAAMRVVSSERSLPVAAHRPSGISRRAASTQPKLRRYRPAVPRGAARRVQVRRRAISLAELQNIGLTPPSVRALASLITDGLVISVDERHYRLPG